jgi:GTP diphosphokinase / guanosine-3',5'-bis(diphosphate) 3'-diphosphatase
MSSSSSYRPPKESTEDLLREGKLSDSAAQVGVNIRELLDFRNPIPRILQAAAFAADKHRQQTRKDKDATPYINHPLALACLLAYECAEQDQTLLIAALLHDTVEDTETTFEEIADRFGKEVAEIVREVTDDKALENAERKRRQIIRAGTASRTAKLVKFADKICNLRDISNSPPAKWSLERKREYFDWAKEVVDQMRGAHGRLEQLFDAEYAKRP